MTGWYREDLAYIHDVGHADFALEVAPGILEILRQSRILEGLVVDLGCGSGLWARELVDAGYRVLGIDISAAMVEISRRRVPEAEFRVGSFFDADIPPCAAVTAISEVLNYLFDEEAGGLRPLFRHVYEALVPGGVFVFDVLGPGQVPPGAPARSFREGKDWAVISEREEDAERGTMTRRIVSFRKVGGALQAGRGGPSRAAVQAGGDLGLARRGGLRGSDDALLRQLPAGGGPRGVRRAQARLR